MFVWLVAVAGFASPWLLAWAFAAAIPIVIHLLTRKRRNNQPWAAIRLLQQALERESRRVRLEQLIILLTRIAILVCLALAAARPFWSGTDSLADQESMRPSRLWIIAIDASCSMGYRSGATSAFQQAKSKTISLIESASEGDAFVLLQVSNPCKPLIGQPTFDRSSALAAVRRLKATDSVADFFECFQITQELLDDAKSNPTTPEDHHVVVFSDMGANSWNSLQDGQGAELLNQLDNRSTLRIISLAPTEKTNLSVSVMHPSQQTIVTDESLEITVQLQNAGDQDAQQIPVQLIADGRTLDNKIADVPARSSRTITFTVPTRTPGFDIYTAEIPPDGLTADDQRHCVVRVTPEIRVLAIESLAGSSRLMQLSWFPTDELKRKRSIQSGSPLELTTLSLDDYDLVLLYDLPKISPQQAQKLNEFVRRGGCVLCCFGPNTQPNGWTPETLGVDLLGFRLEQTSGESQWTLDAADYQSPVVRPFEGFPESGLLTTPIVRYWQIESSPGLLTDLAIADKEPFIVRWRLGRGWFTSILSAPQSGVEAGRQPWNSMAAWPSFVPLMQQLLRVTLQPAEEFNNRIVSQAISGSVPWEILDSPVKIVRPSGEETEILAQPSDDNDPSWQFRETQSRGVYRAQLSDGTMEPFAVNVDPVESKLESVSQLTIPFYEDLESGVPAAVATSSTPSRNYAQTLLAVVLALLIGESLLARFVGRRVG